MNVKQLKEIIMNLDDNYEVRMEEQIEKIDTIPIKTVEISLETREIILKTGKNNKNNVIKCFFYWR